MKRRANGSGSLFRRGGTWYIKIRVGGVLVKKSCRTADRAEARRQLDLMAVGCQLTDEDRLAVVARRLQSRGESVTIEAAWERYVAAPENLGQTAGAAEVDRGRWLAFVRWLHGYDGGPRCRINCKAAFPGVKRLADVDARVVEGFLAHCRGRGGVSPSTLNRYLRILRRMWRLCGETVDPWARVPRQRVRAHLRRALTRDELRRVVDAASGELRVLFLVGIYTGMRLSDCARLRWDDVDLPGGVIACVPSKTSRFRTCVTIPLHPSLRDALAGVERRGDYVLREIATWPKDRVSDAVQAHFAAVGLAESERPDGYKRHVATVGFHSLRSTFVSMMADAGAPLAMVQSIVGHLSPEMTQQYYRADLEAARARISALPSV